MPKAADPPQPPPPPPPEYQPAPAYQAPPGYQPPPPAMAPAAAAMKMPPWLDIGLIVMGIGTLLIFIGFLFGDAAFSQFPTGGGSGSLTNFTGDMEAFFVVSGLGILLTVGGWLFRVIMALRRGHA